MRSSTATKIAYGFIVLSLTYFLSQLYINGDQVHYFKAYNQIHQYGIKEAFILYNDLLDSSELVHFILIWSVGEYFDKSIVMSISNAVLAYLATTIMLRRGANKIIVLMVLLISYYPMVLFLSAERLKFAFIFFFLSILMYDLRWKKISAITASVSILAHIQILISYATILFPKLINSVASIFKDGVIKKSLIYTSIFLIILLFLMFDQLMRKTPHYIQLASLVDLAKVLILFTLTLFYAQDKKWFAATLFAPLLLVTTIIGAERIIFYGYFIFLYFALQVRGGYNLGIICSLLYGLSKSILFFTSIYKFGDGFECASYMTCFS